MTPPTVFVTGTAAREVPPDTFTLNVNVLRRAGSSAAAYSALAVAYGEVESELAKWPLEVDRAAVVGHPDHDDRKRTSGWVAMRSLQVTGRDLERIADLTGALGRLPDIGITGPSWAIDDDNPAHDELQAAAVHAARARAQRYAAALDGTLGALVELSDPDQHGGWGRAAKAMMFSGSPESADVGLEALDLAPKPVPISATVHARWYLVLPD